MTELLVRADPEPGGWLPIATIRTELEQHRRFRIDQIERLASDAAAVTGTSDDTRLQVTRALVQAAEAALTEIDAALQRLDSGGFGHCEHCQQAIPVGRLEALPMSRLCTPCQYRAESNR